MTTKPTNQSVEEWEKKQLRVLSKCSPELLKITGKHSMLWHYPKLETMDKLADLISLAKQQAREEVAEEIRKRLNYKPIYMGDEAEETGFNKGIIAEQGQIQKLLDSLIKKKNDTH